MRPLSSAATLCLAALLPGGLGCSSGGSPNGGAPRDAGDLPELAGPPTDLAPVIDLAAAPMPDLPAQPEVISLGGPVLANPRVRLIAYASDPAAADVEAFLQEYGATAWSAQTSEYGIGPYSILPTIRLQGAPPALIDEGNGNQPSPFQQTLAANVSGNNPVWGAEDGSVIYLFLLPQGTDIQAGGSCCTDFLGYHDEAPLGGGKGAPYAVVCHCPGSGGGLTGLQLVTTTVNHELVEAATDPFVQTRPAYAQADDANAIWTVFTGGEIADLCEYEDDANYQPPGSKYMLQRTWSNAAARAGADPCVPTVGNAPWFNSYPVYSDSIRLDYGGPTVTKGVNIPVGQTRTVDVVLASPGGAAVGSWKVRAWDLSDYLSLGAANTSVSFDRTSGGSGDVLKLTITVKSYNPSFGGAGVVIESSLGGQDNLTVIAVGQ